MCFLHHSGFISMFSYLFLIVLSVSFCLILFSFMIPKFNQWLLNRLKVLVSILQTHPISQHWWESFLESSMAIQLICLDGSFVMVSPSITRLLSRDIPCNFLNWDFPNSPILVILLPSTLFHILYTRGFFKLKAFPAFQSLKWK